MDTDINALVNEVDRIVNSPYPTQLKTLYDIVSRSSEAELCFWATSYPCRVQPLARVLIDALPHWPYVLDLTIRLSSVIPLRDAVLECEPSLLEHVISKATDSQSINRKYLDLSVVLLSHTLPDSVTLPVTTQTLLIQLFQRAVAQPEVSLLEPIYRLLYGACRPLIGVLPFRTLSDLESRLISIMRTLASVSDKTPAIYCLSIMQLIVDGFNTTPQSTPLDVWNDLDCSSSSPSEDRWSPDTLANLFQGSRGQKTLSLVALQVIWACTAGMEKSQPENTLASVVLANSILAAVPIHDKEEWWICSRNVQIVRKLQQRCLVPDISSTLRFQALTFLSSLSGSDALSQHYVSAYEQLMLDLGNNLTAIKQLDFSLEVSLPHFAQAFEPQWWETFVGNLLEMLVRPQAEAVLRSAASITVLFNRFSDMVGGSSQCRQGLITALSSFRHRQKLELFLNEPVLESKNTQGSCCENTVLGLVSRLASAFCSLILRSALAVQSNETPLPSNLIPGVLKRHGASRPAVPQCHTHHQHSRGLSHRQTLFVEVEGTPDNGQAHLPWRERLVMKMQTQARDQQQGMIASFAEICRDLEVRCETTEAPLREQQEKLIDLQTRHEQLGKAYGELESQIMDRDLRVNALEAENDSLAAELEASAVESQALMQRVEDATQELHRANEDARISLATARQERDKLELTHATTMACKQAALDETKEELQKSVRETDSLRSRLAHLEEGGKQNDAQHERLQSNVKDLESRLSEQREQFARAEDERKTLSNTLNLSRQEVSTIREEGRRLRLEKDSLTTELEDLKAASKRDMDRAMSAFEESMADSREEWSNVRSNLEDHLSKARRELIQAEDNLHEQQEASRQKMSDLRKKIDRLTMECHTKDAQVVEAQEMRNRLMNAMGLTNIMPAVVSTTFQEPSTKSSALPYRSASTMVTPRPSSQPLLSTPARGVQEIDLDNDDEGLNSDASNLSSDHGPTPKRARPRQTVRRGSVNARHSLGSRSIKSVLRNGSTTKRQPLANIDANRSPRKSARSPSKVSFGEMNKQTLDMSTAEAKDMEDWSFSNADIVSGTPGVGLKDRMEQLMEEDTADI